MNTTIAISATQLRQGGGTERYVLDLIDGFLDKQQSIKVYTTKVDNQLPQYNQIDVVEINQKKIIKKLRAFFFSHQLQKIRPQNETLIACNPSDNADVYVCGGTHLGYLRAMGKKPNLLDRLAIYRNKTNFATAKRIMAHSQLMQKELIELYGISSDKIEVVYPPVNSEQFYPDVDIGRKVRQQYGFAEHEVIFLFPSTGHQRKGLDVLATFFEQTDLPVKLAVAGSPLPRPMKNVIELGFCQNMPDLYRAVDYTIMASVYEPFGLVGIESVLCGTRVVFARNMACTEVLKQDAGFFFDRESEASLAKAITDAVQLQQLGQHKIAQPLENINYVPILSHHIDKIMRMLNP